MMKKISFLVAMFVVTVFCIDRIFSFVYTKYIFRYTLSGESGGSLNYLLNRKRQSEFLILGSSRAKHHLDPSCLSNLYNGNGYNAGINGVGKMVYNEVLLDIIVGNRLIPKMVVLQTDAYLFTNENDGNLQSELIPLYPFLNTSIAMQNYMGWRERVKLSLNSYQYNGKVLNIAYNYLKRSQVRDNNGFAGLLGSMREVAAGKQKSVRKIETATFSEIKVNALRNTVALCKKNNIRLAVVLMPFYGDKGPHFDLNKKFLQMLNEQGIMEIVDFSSVNSIPELAPARFWKDGAHLNEEGARILSKAVNNRLGSRNGTRFGD